MPKMSDESQNSVILGDFARDFATLAVNEINVREATARIVAAYREKNLSHGLAVISAVSISMRKQLLEKKFVGRHDNYRKWLTAGFQELQSYATDKPVPDIVYEKEAVKCAAPNCDKQRELWDFRLCPVCAIPAYWLARAEQSPMREPKRRRMIGTEGQAKKGQAKEGQPSMEEQPSMEQPSMEEQPSVEQPSMEKQPSVEQPSVEQPSVEQPSMEEQTPKGEASEVPLLSAAAVEIKKELTSDGNKTDENPEDDIS